MKKKFITNLGFLILLNVLIKPLYVFGIDRVVQNTLGAEVYGSFFVLFNIALIFQILLDLGIENFIRREIARHPEKVDHYLSNIMILRIILVIPYALICAGVAWLLGVEAGEYQLLLLILLNQFLASFILYLRANLGGLHFFKTEGLVSVLDRSLMILIVGFLLLHPLTFGKFSIFWFVLAQSISYGIVILIGLMMVLRKAGSFRLEFSWQELQPIIRQLLPYATLALLMGAYYRIDTLLLHKLLPNGKEQAGIFAHAFRILDFMSNYALLFPVLLLPMFSRVLKQNEPVGDLLRLAVLLLFIPSLAVVIPSILFRSEIFTLLYDSHTHLSGDVFGILSISFLGMCVSYTYGALLTANGNLNALNYMALSALVFSAVLNILLIPRFAVLGAAIANAAAQLLTIGVHVALAKKYLSIGIRFILLLKVLLFLGLCTGISILLKGMFMNWILAWGIAIMSCILVALLLGLLRYRDVQHILQGREE